jgi:hypothetical protein
MIRALGEAHKAAYRNAVTAAYIGAGLARWPPRKRLPPLERYLGLARRPRRAQTADAMRRELSKWP